MATRNYKNQMIDTIDDLPTRTIHTCFDGKLSIINILSTFAHNFNPFCTLEFFYAKCPFIGDFYPFSKNRRVTSKLRGSTLI